MTRSVPNLQSDTLIFTFFIFHLDLFGVKIGPNSGFILLLQFLATVLLNQARLADSAIPKHHYFENVVFLGSGGGDVWTFAHFYHPL